MSRPCTTVGGPLVPLGGGRTHPSGPSLSAPSSASRHHTPTHTAGVLGVQPHLLRMERECLSHETDLPPASATLPRPPSLLGRLSPSGSLLDPVQREVSPLASSPHLWGLSVLEPFSQALGLARSQWTQGPARGALDSLSLPDGLAAPLLPGQAWHLTPPGFLSSTSTITEILHTSCTSSTSGNELTVLYRRWHLLTPATSPPIGTILRNPSRPQVLHGSTGSQRLLVVLMPKLPLLHSSQKGFISRPELALDRSPRWRHFHSRLRFIG